MHDPVSAADYNLSLKLAATAGTPRGQVTAAPWMGGERKAPSPQAPAPLGDASNAAPTPLTGLSHREKLDEHFADGSLVLNDNKMFHRKSERIRVNL